MARSFVIGLAVIISCGVAIMACGGNPSGVTVPVDVTVPSSSTIWRHYQSEASIQWNGGSTDNVSIRLFKGGEILELLASSAPNSGTYVLSSWVSPSWGTGADYTIMIEDGFGQVGLSQAFEIAVSEGAEIIQVSQPSSGTVWSHYQTDVGVSWSYPAGKAGASHLPLTGREGGAVLSGDEVDIELYQGANKVATLASGVPANAGNYNYPDPVPPAWGTGTDYRIRIVDDLGNFGYSGSFSIEETAGQELINVTVPNSSTVWAYQQTGTTVQWEYPRPASLSAGNGGQHRSGDVRMEIWKDGVKVGDYCGWVSNTGSYTRSNPLLNSWAGSGYRIRIIDSDNNYGISAIFSISEPSGSEVIEVINPNSSTVWDYGQSGTTVEWDYPYWRGFSGCIPFGLLNASAIPDRSENVRMEIWKDGVKVGDYCGWVPNTGSYTRTEPLADSWGGSGYRIRVIDSDNNFGSSASFTISEPSGSEVIEVINPNSSTVWEYGQSGTTVEWDYPYWRGFSGRIPLGLVNASTIPDRSENVRMEIWKEGVKIGDYCGWVPNTGSYTRSESLPSAWGTGFNYQIKVVDSNGNYGLSENFMISGSIDVTNPNSSTVWEIGETNTQVQWSGGAAQVKLEVWYQGSKRGDYSGWIDNTGSYTRTAPIPDSWEIGQHFRIRVVEAGSNPNDGYSDEFQIFDDVNVTEPNSGTSWAWGESGVTVQWSEGYSDSVMISLYKGGTYVGMVSEWIPNSGSFTRSEAVSSSWGTGSDYRVKVTGNLGSYGFSDYFSVWAYDITEPNPSTFWYWGQTNTQILWEPGPGSIVRMEIWKGGSKVDDYCGWTDDDGEYTRTAAIPEAWGEGSDYRIKMIDDIGNIGWSDMFSIYDPIYYPTDVVAYYRLDGDAEDVTGNNSGLITNLTYDENGKIAGCYVFSNGNINLGSSDDLDYFFAASHASIPFSICLWIYVTDLSPQFGYYPLLHIGPSSSNWQFNLGIYDEAHAHGSSLYMSSHSATNPPVAETPFEKNRWYFVSAVYDGDIAFLYIDGELEAMSDIGNLTKDNQNSNLLVGYAQAWNSYFKGKIDEIGIWNRELSYLEIQMLYNNGYGLTYPE